eukprot:31253-Pelagococcus_subviridis.AAC.3
MNVRDELATSAAFFKTFSGNPARRATFSAHDPSGAGPGVSLYSNVMSEKQPPPPPPPPFPFPFPSRAVVAAAMCAATTPRSSPTSSAS